MNAKDKWVAEQTEALRARQAELIAQGIPDEGIPVQIAQLGCLWDITLQGRKAANTAAFSTSFRPVPGCPHTPPAAGRV